MQSNIFFCAFTVRAAAKPVEPVSGPVEPVLGGLPSRRRPLFSPLLSSLLSISLSFLPVADALISLSLSHLLHSNPSQNPPNLSKTSWRLLWIRSPRAPPPSLSTSLRDSHGRFLRSRYCYFFLSFDSIHTVLEYLKSFFKDIV
jgi:hypothetical protein